MGSQRQDSLHERLLEEARSKVSHLERQVAAAKSESDLVLLEQALAVARQDLAVHEAIDKKRD